MWCSRPLTFRWPIRRLEMFVMLGSRNASDVSCQQREDAETLADRASKNSEEESEEFSALTSSCRCSMELTGMYLACPGKSTDTLSFLTKTDRAAPRCFSRSAWFRIRNVFIESTSLTVNR
uniref:(northern house mosquito) hypothetical protein n=1 Tax=Culex pipiens TaxID=7175 RepID=A0A8D8MSR3_CULPI